MNLGPIGKGVLFLAGLVLVGAGLLYLGPKTAQAPGPVACTMEAKQCPDGSWVGRTGPNCEFVCPTATTTPPTGGGGGIAPYHSGIRGTVMAGPTCPVERNPPDPQCADRPLQTNVSIFRASDPAHGIAFITSNAQGAFQVSLSPGDYVIEAGPYGVPLPRCNPTKATVGAAGYTNIIVECDTGIR